MKLFLKNSLLCCLLLYAQASIAQITETKNYAPYPQPQSGYVTDYAGFLDKEEEEKIERWLWQVESRSQVEIIIVTIDSLKTYPKTQNQSIESFATALFNTYGIGNLPQNDGILLLISKQDRKARIELGAGYSHLRDADAQRIMDKMILPAFKKQHYASGITNGTKALIKEFTGLEVGFPWSIINLILGSLICLSIAFSLFTNGKRGWGYVFIGLSIVLILVAIYIAVSILRHLPSSDSDNWSSGGMGGFGGGFSGGGGASGGW